MNRPFRYATARLHDLSWGTRDTSSGEALASRQEAVENVAMSIRRDVLLYNGLLLILTFCLDLIFGEVGFDLGARRGSTT